MRKLSFRARKGKTVSVPLWLPLGSAEATFPFHSVADRQAIARQTSLAASRLAQGTCLRGIRSLLGSAFDAPHARH
jgi:hypothetical protein